MTISIRPLAAADYDGWLPLYEGYCHFYEAGCDEAQAKRVWDWLLAEDHPLEGLVAQGEQGELLGLAHFYPWHSTLHGSTAMYLSDLFVAPAARGSQVGKTLYLNLFEVAAARGWTALTLLTQESNAIGRSLYDQFGSCTDFRFYVSPVPLADART